MGKHKHWLTLTDRIQSQRGVFSSRISQTVEKAAARTLVHKIRQVVEDGDKIVGSLTHLSEQHKWIYAEIVREMASMKTAKGMVNQLLLLLRNSCRMKYSSRNTRVQLVDITLLHWKSREQVEFTLFNLQQLIGDLKVLLDRAGPLANMTSHEQGVEHLIKNERLTLISGHHLGHPRYFTLFKIIVFRVIYFLRFGLDMGIARG